MACLNPAVGGNPVNNVPLKPGAPLSTACERANTIDSIPEVLRTPWFTIVGGALVTTYRVSPGGLINPNSYFKSRQGCYYNEHGRLAGSTCATGNPCENPAAYY